MKDIAAAQEQIVEESEGDGMSSNNNLQQAGVVFAFTAISSDLDDDLQNLRIISHVFLFIYCESYSPS